MKKSVFVACLLALCGGFVGCVADTAEPGAPSTSIATETGLEPAAPDGPAAEPDRSPAPSSNQVPKPDATSATATVATPEAPPYAEEESIDRHLERLADLELFEVGALLTSIPGETYSCPYNQPCPGEEQDRVTRIQHARLSELLAIGEDLRDSEGLAEPTQAPEEHLAALRSLFIVEIGELIVDEPASSVNCYNLPCPADIEAADASNRRRAEVLEALAERSSDL